MKQAITLALVAMALAAACSAASAALLPASHPLFDEETVHEIRVS